MAVRRADIAAEAIGRRMTLKEFLELPETQPASEFVNGMVTQKVAPQGQHVVLQSELVHRINVFARPQKRALAFPALRTSYGGLSRVSDVAVYLWERIPRLKSGRIANRFSGPPDIAVEIVSPGQTGTDLIGKCIWYVKNGVRIALVIDPAHDTVLRFRPDASPDSLTGDDRIDLDEVLPGFELTVRDLFASLMLD